MTEADLIAIRNMKLRALDLKCYDVAMALRCAEELTKDNLREQWTNNLLNGAIKDAPNIDTVEPPY